jgi:hypothetical protein
MHLQLQANSSLANLSPSEAPGHSHKFGTKVNQAGSVNTIDPAVCGLKLEALVVIFLLLKINFETVLETYRYIQVATVHGAMAECGDSSYPGKFIFTLTIFLVKIVASDCS